MSDPGQRLSHLLVADDDGHIREVVRYALAEAGYEVTLANDGRAAWELFEKAEHTAPFDLLVLDIVMPGLDGLEVCRKVRGQSRVPVIFVSSRDEELDRVLGLELGADDYVTKPFSPRELVARIKATLRRYAEIRELLQQAPSETEQRTHAENGLTTVRLLWTPRNTKSVSTGGQLFSQ